MVANKHFVATADLNLYWTKFKSTFYSQKELTMTWFSSQWLKVLCSTLCYGLASSETSRKILNPLRYSMVFHHPLISFIYIYIYISLPKMEFEELQICNWQKFFSLGSVFQSMQIFMIVCGHRLGCSFRSSSLGSEKVTNKLTALAMYDRNNTNPWSH